MTIPIEAIECYRADGYCLVRQRLPVCACTALLTELSSIEGLVGEDGLRELMARVPAIAELALSDALLGIARQLLGPVARPVRSVYFDKLPIRQKKCCFCGNYSAHP